jgi:hypothetical protein
MVREEKALAASSASANYKPHSEQGASCVQVFNSESPKSTDQACPGLHSSKTSAL